MKNSTEDEKEAIRKIIVNYKKEISLLRSYTLSPLIKKYSSEEILPDDVRENKLLVFLLRHGYIDEHYAEYPAVLFRWLLLDERKINHRLCRCDPQ